MAFPSKHEKINNVLFLFLKLTDEGGKSALKVALVDILIAENGKEHNTYDYEMMERPTGANLVVRRGQPFHLLLKLNRNFDPATDAISLIFTVAGMCETVTKSRTWWTSKITCSHSCLLNLLDAKFPSPNSGTQLYVPVLSSNSTSLPAGGWWARLVASGDLSIKVQVCWKTKNDDNSMSISWPFFTSLCLAFRFAHWQQA